MNNCEAKRTDAVIKGVILSIAESIKKPWLPLISLSLLIICGCSSKDVTGPTAEGWVLEKVASGTQNGLHSSLVTTADGTVHIAYHDADRERLYHARRIGPNSWIHTRLDSIGRFGRYVTMAVDSGDSLHLAYQDNYHADLRYALFDGSSWEYERLQLSSSYGGSPKLLVRPEGIHLLEYNNDSRKINYWQGSLADWRLSASITLYRPIFHSFHFVVGADGPVVAGFEERYVYGTTLTLWKAAAPESLWSVTILISNSDPITPPVLQYDRAGNLHILYQEADGDLIDRREEGPGNIVDNVFGSGPLCLEQGVGSSDGLWLLYSFQNGIALGYLEYLYSWERIAFIPDIYPSGQYDLHVAQDGSIHISVYSETLKELYYGWWEGVP